MGDHTITMKISASQTGTVTTAAYFKGGLDNDRKNPNFKRQLQVTGTFSSASMKPYITLDGSNYTQLKDSAGSAVTVTAATILNVEEVSPYPVKCVATQAATGKSAVTIEAKYW